MNFNYLLDKYPNELKNKNYKHCRRLSTTLFANAKSGYILLYNLRSNLS